MSDVQANTEIETPEEHEVIDQEPGPAGAGVSWPMRLVFAGLLLAVFGLGYFAVQRLLSDDPVQAISGELLSAEGVLFVRGAEQGAVIDIREVVPGYGSTMNLVGFASDGDNGFVAAFSASFESVAPEGVVVHVPANAAPVVVLDEQEAGVGRLLGVFDGVAVYQEAIPSNAGEITATGDPAEPLTAVMTIDLASGERNELTAASPGSTSMGGSRVLAPSADGCATFNVYDLADASVVNLQPFPEDPGCYSATFVPDRYISRDGSQVAFLRLWDSKIEAAALDIDNPAELAMRFSAPQALLLSDVSEQDFLELLGRDVFDVDIEAALLSDVEDME